MCEFCTKHGEGKKWYLRAENYSEDLLSDLRRRRFIGDFFKDPDALGSKIEETNNLNRLPSFVQAVLRPALVNKQKKVHYGQVVPIEAIEEILGFVSSVTRLPCICRQFSSGSEHRYCYGISMVPGSESQMLKIQRSIDADYLTGPDISGLEEVPKEEALEQMRDLEKKGLYHSVWTFVAPFIGGICNCDRDCLALKATQAYAFPVMFRAEHVAGVDPDRCIGCRACMAACNFGAMRYSLANKKVDIEAEKCYGCGICRAYCTKDAIELKDRSAVPEAANIW